MIEPREGRCHRSQLMPSPLAGFGLYISTRPRVPDGHPGLSMTTALRACEKHCHTFCWMGEPYQHDCRVFYGLGCAGVPRSAGHGMVAPRLALGGRDSKSYSDARRVSGNIRKNMANIPRPLRGRLYKKHAFTPRQDLGATFPSPAQGGAVLFLSCGLSSLQVEGVADGAADGVGFGTVAAQGVDDGGDVALHRVAFEAAQTGHVAL